MGGCLTTLAVLQPQYNAPRPWKNITNNALDGKMLGCRVRQCTFLPSLSTSLFAITVVAAPSVGDLVSMTVIGCLLTTAVSFVTMVIYFHSEEIVRED